ncbi:oxidative damage protection protein [Suttonella indologenes]|uniref:Probable Fe(2+)-trafficking protein n=1 Tax=Suttonella indologenes TaxID=13276 RepID=A0A380MXD9_9GAMM|nr:oxidative damage protection protein [Suttonella indologenes]SUO96573.1 Probable Fe(2+)-trafficking protein [Suttonella indologenes]
MATIFCQKLQREAEQLPRKPIPGEIGERVFQHISKEAWELWLKQQTMLINEYRLSSFEPETKAFLREKMEAFLFGDENVSPQEYRPQ